MQMARNHSHWGNLAGPPARLSESVTPSSRRPYQGWIKLRLCIANGRTYFLPDVLIGFEGTKFFIPSFFGPPVLSFNIPSSLPNSAGKRHQAKFTIDVASPRGPAAARLQVTFCSGDFVRSYRDGAQLYRCSYVGPQDVRLSPVVAGNCRLMQSGDFALEVFHHTLGETKDKILASAELWSGSSNLAGTRNLKNVAYTYFTTLPTIGDEADLRRIAMSSVSSIKYQTTSDLPVEAVLDLPVYRSMTADRTATLKFNVPSEIVAPAHLLFHPMVYAHPAYYEVVGAEIVRVGVQPGSKLSLDGSNVVAAVPDLKDFSYVVEGNAATTVGLEAPMKEDSTDEIAHLEILDEGQDLFDFWLSNQNTDLFRRRVFEPRMLALPIST